VSNFVPLTAISLNDSILSYPFNSLHFRFRLTSCYGGLGGRWCFNKYMEEGAYDLSGGYLAYTPVSGSSPDEIVDDLCGLLTSGRMGNSNRKIIKDAYSGALNTGTDDSALRVALQLVVSSPEYHTTGTVSNGRTKRSLESGQTKTCKKYKAVVHLMLEGGMDSYNLLVPHSGCSGKASYNDYATARGSVKLELNSLLPIDASSSPQPCEMYGLHPQMSVLQTLYNDKDASFIAGIGVLSKPVTKSDYLTKTVTTLFDHLGSEFDNDSFVSYSQ